MASDLTKEEIAYIYKLKNDKFLLGKILYKICIKLLMM